MRRALLALACAAVVAWIASYFLWMSLCAPLWGRNARMILYQVRGHVQLHFVTRHPHPATTIIEVEVLAELERRLSQAGFMFDGLRPPMFRFHHADITRADGVRVAYIVAGVPHWLLVIVMGLWPLIFWVRQRHRGRPVRACTSCGYDLSGLPPLITCPECGAAETPASST